MSARRLLSIIDRLNATLPRLAYSEEESAALCFLFGLFPPTMRVRRDAIGNLIARLPGSDPDAPAIALGSHVDTVHAPGPHDGTVGSAAAVEVLLRLVEERIPLACPVEAIIFRAEESARFGAGCLGSRMLWGQAGPETLDLFDPQTGRKLRAAMGLCFAEPSEIETARRLPSEFRAFLELHIEQGPILSGMGIPIGVVTHIAAPARLEVSFHGSADHSGTTPMGRRKDALLGAATLALHVERLALARRHPNCVATVGRLHVEPNSTNTIPGCAWMVADVRDVNVERRAGLIEEIVHHADETADARGLEVEYRVLQAETPRALDAQLAALIWDCARARGLHCLDVASGAAHDALSFAAAGVPTGMIFIPSRDGRSHCPEEWSEPEHIAQGAEVLYEVVRALTAPGGREGGENHMRGENAEEEHRP